MPIRHCHLRCLELYCSNAPTGKLNALCDTLGKGLDKVYTLAKGLVRSWRWTSSTAMAGRTRRSSLPIQDEELSRTDGEQYEVPAPQGSSAPPPPLLANYGTVMQGIVLAIQTQA
ncbi:hypothetical protein Taro_001895 [Colocasia esculenta]|uniref:Uncharacterized protein n=1 Tax=Colocasia esculenta TaxID=4460 RepID=A0A843TFU6_COLES|nr:hypothetical protein [Colocasia esculenta]